MISNPDPIKLRDEMCSGIIGRTVSYQRLAANSLMLYIDSAPDERTGFMIWFEPTWRLTSASSILIGSDQDCSGTKEDLARIGEPLRRLLGQRVENISVDERSKDLLLVVEGEF